MYRLDVFPNGLLDNLYKLDVFPNGTQALPARSTPKYTFLIGGPDRSDYDWNLHVHVPNW